MMIMGKADMLDLDRLLKWAVKRQMPLEGGFQGRTNKLVDGCYSFWVGGVFPLLDFLLRKQGDEAHLGEQGREWLFNQRELQKYLLVCCQMVSTSHPALVPCCSAFDRDQRSNGGRPRSLTHSSPLGCFCVGTEQ